MTSLEIKDSEIYNPIDYKLIQSTLVKIRDRMVQDQRKYGKNQNYYYIDDLIRPLKYYSNVKSFNELKILLKQEGFFLRKSRSDYSSDYYMYNMKGLINEYYSFEIALILLLFCSIILILILII